MIDVSKVGLGCANVFAADFLQLIDLASRHGFSAIGGRPLMYAKARAEGLSEADIQKRLADAGVRVGMIDGLVGVLPGELPPEKRHPSLQVLPRDINDSPDEAACLDIAVALGAKLVNTSALLCAPLPVEEMGKAVAALARRAGDRGLRLVLEFIPHTGLPNLAFAQAVVEASGARNVGLLLDTFHFDRTGGTAEDVRRLPPGAIATIQLSDRIPPAEPSDGPIERPRLMPGDGHIDLKGIVSAALENSPDAYVEMEVISGELSALPWDEAVARLAAGARAWAASVA
jgi:sugar phosphate isomerase/epimerase